MYERRLGSPEGITPLYWEHIDEARAAIALKGVVGKRLTTKQLVARMPKKKAQAKRPKGYATLSQKEKFLAAAKEFEVDETGKTFLKSFKTIATRKPKAGVKKTKA